MKVSTLKIPDSGVLKRYRQLKVSLAESRQQPEDKKLDQAFNLMYTVAGNAKDLTGQSIVQSALETAEIAIREIGLGATSLKSIFLHRASLHCSVRADEIRKEYDTSVSVIFSGLEKISYVGSGSHPSDAENLRKLLLNLARDVRVILICIAQHLQLMRRMDRIPEELQIRLASDASYLYSPLAHRLGLYIIKSEMDDLYLKYTDRKTYDLIAKKLAETMKERKNFIEEFINPLSDVLKANGFSFEIRGRPKSIYSIWNKMKKKEMEFEDIYDLFAIRIILNSDLANEKADCWKVYSLVTDIYQPNPLRLRDWISVPKTNGYESLHTTVIGPEGRWVEVQIRTTRMNEIAEKGFAAHWKYKGLEAEQGLDEWLAKVREILETPEADAVEFIDDFKLSLYSKEIFVFTPKGQLRKFPSGSTVLDFAYDIHSDVGSACTGAKVNGKNVPIRHVLHNGDRIEIQTSKNQTPKLDWLNFVITSKAKAKIRQKLNEEKFREAENGKEILKRRLKNWKIPYTDDMIRILLKKYKLKNAQDLYYLISTEKIELGEIKDCLTGGEQQQEEGRATAGEKSPETEKTFRTGEDFLIIDEKVSNIDYKLSKCCSPIFGDDIFGFVTINDGIKIHRTNCPNAARLLSKYGYRVVKAKWNKSDGTTSFPVEIKISGEDVPGLLNSISDVISREFKIALRSISLDTDNGLFQGSLRLMVLDIKHLDSLIARLSKIKGIYSVRRQESYTDQ
ncbi:MAG: bifunctional (p)ppGpp synthetase/guanosine-3',5'-bis(diphosphate) 3'-pyrophosphohydrolase [Bacteroidales bacterium]|nr:bifunctional (p)ppGpp synthetase/guanosine-3',5'-bis(diphosphate) 3'-pyrophosphohydrolase [Bacteroidales bacterium]